MSTVSTTPSRRAAPLLFLVLFAVVCGFVGVAFRIFNRTELVEKPPAPPLVQIPVAAADLEPGRKIQASDYFVKPMTNEEFAKVADGKYVFNSGKNLNGRILRQAVKAGTPFVLDCVYLEGTGPTPAELLTEGMRALTVSVTLVGGVRGFVAPNSWVDVLFRRSQLDTPESTDIARTHTLLSGVRVIALQDNTYSGTVLFSNKNGVATDAFELTLEVTPEQAEVLKSLEGRGDLSLNMLPNDPSRKNLGNLPSPEVMKIVLGVEEPEPVAPPVIPAAPPSVRIVRGGAQSQVTVDYQTDLIMNDALYPASPHNTTPQPDTPKPPIIDQPTVPAWPQRRVVPVPSPDEDADKRSDPEKTTPDASAPTSAPASTQPPRRSQSDDSSSIIVQRRLNNPSRTRLPGPADNPRSLHNPTQSAIRNSQAPRYQTSTSSGYSQRSQLPTLRSSSLAQRQSHMPGIAPLRRNSGGISQVSFSRPADAYYSNRPKSMPVLMAGAQAPKLIPARPITPISPARYASDPRRPVVLSPSTPTAARRPAATKSAERPSPSPGALQLYTISSALPSQTSRLPVLKSGRQD
jgi:Flp pilus assembly protein CpaB